MLENPTLFLHFVCFMKTKRCLSKKIETSPNLDTDEKDSWIELEFTTTPEEQEALKDEYKSEDNKLIVLRYFHLKNA